jgi:anthranilate synthase component 2
MGDSSLFMGLPKKLPGARYHSLAALSDTLPEKLQVVARAEDGEVMAVTHREYPIYGLQFHPESILTPDGKQILKNFMEVAKS